MNVLRMTAVLTTAIAAVSLSVPAQAGAPAINVPCGKQLAAVHPAAGSTVALKRGCTYTGPLTITADDVTVTAYGTGRIPAVTLRQDGAAIDVSGSGTTITDVSLTGTAPRTWICGGRRTPAGHVDGIDLEGGSTGNTVTNVSATGFYAGAYVDGRLEWQRDREFDIHQ